jgi:hypothetical protein
MIQTADLGTRHHNRLKAARLLGGYVAGGLLSDDQAYGALSQALVGHTDDLPRSLKTVEDGLAYGRAHPITLEELEAERRRWLEQHCPLQGDCWRTVSETSGVVDEAAARAVLRLARGVG